METPHRKNSDKDLPYPVYFYTILSLTLVGIGATTYLAYTHYKNYTDLEYSSFCALSRTINCDTVSQSPWSVFLSLPVAYWGLFGYLFLLCLLYPLRKPESRYLGLWRVVFFTALLFSIISGTLGYISATKIHSYCIMCIVTYGTNFSLFTLSWITARRLLGKQFCNNNLQSIALLWQKKILLYPITLLACCFFITVLFIPSYWSYEYPTNSTDIASGVTNDGHPWIGAEQPILTIEEFSDYQCFQCSKMHHFLRNLVRQNPDKIRLVHRNYPMDHAFNSIVVPDPFHIGSGKMALVASFSTTLGKFWEVNDALYLLASKKEPFNLATLSEMTGISTQALAQSLTSAYARDMLRYDIWHGMKLEITATPTFLIDDKTYVGTIPGNMIKMALADR